MVLVYNAGSTGNGENVIAIVDYGAGNLTSVRLAFEKIGVNAGVTNDPAVILKADKVVFPGVGSALAAMRNLEKLRLAAVLKEVVQSGTPFLGICLGAQIVLQRSEEDGGVDCLGLIPGTVKAFKPADRTVKVPQIGWNNVAFARQHPVFSGVKDGSEFYFVHSYYPMPTDSECAVGTTEYAGVSFASVLGRDNLVAMQFHPERSGRIGLKLLENFSGWNGKTK